VLLAEEAEPRPFRSVLTAWVATAHVALQTTTTASGSRTVARHASRQRAGNPISEQLGEAVNEKIKGMRGASGHIAPLREGESLRNPGNGSLHDEPARRLQFSDPHHQFNCAIIPIEEARDRRSCVAGCAESPEPSLTSWFRRSIWRGAAPCALVSGGLDWLEAPSRPQPRVGRTRRG
jgi:hypothetical protein